LEVNDKGYRKYSVRIALISSILFLFWGLCSPRGYAEQVKQNTIADEVSNRSITIWKYQVKDLSELGDRGDGSAASVDKTALPGIKFEIVKVEGLNDSVLSNPIGLVKDVDYQMVGNTQTITTDTDGKATLDLGIGTKADGIYLVTELADDRGTKPAVVKPADPFFVSVPQTNRQNQASLIYDVEVQPKNILESLLEPEKTIENGKGLSLKAGEEFEWEATVNLPNDLHTVLSQDMTITPNYDENGSQIADLELKKGDELYATYFRIADTLNGQLKLEDIRVEVLTDMNKWEPLEIATDYKVSLNDKEITDHPVKDHNEGEKKILVSLTQNGMKKSTELNGKKIRVVYKNFTDKDFNGVIRNHIDVDYLTPGQKPVNVPSEKDPEYYTGGFDIEKVTKSQGKKLSGAQFHIADSKASAENGRFIAQDGKTYASEGEAEAAGTKLLTAISNEDGLAMFNGLALNWFEDVNKNGKQDPEEPTFAQSEIKKEYWLVETKAPKGYELVKTPINITVTLNTATNQKVEVVVVNEPATVLPFTGGKGTLGLVVMAFGLILIGCVLYTIDKRRQQA